MIVTLRTTIQPDDTADILAIDLTCLGACVETKLFQRNWRILIADHDLFTVALHMDVFGVEAARRDFAEVPS